MCGADELGVVHEIDCRSGGFIVARFGVRQAGIPVDRGMQMGVIDPRLLRSGLPPLGSFGLCRSAAMDTPPATLRDSAALLHIDVHHLTSSFHSDDLRFSVVLTGRVNEQATVQSQVPQDSRRPFDEQ